PSVPRLVRRRTSESREPSRARSGALVSFPSSLHRMRHEELVRGLRHVRAERIGPAVVRVAVRIGMRRAVDDPEIDERAPLRIDESLDGVRIRALESQDTTGAAPVLRAGADVTGRPDAGEGRG